MGSEFFHVYASSGITFATYGFSFLTGCTRVQRVAPVVMTLLMASLLAKA